MSHHGWLSREGLLWRTPKGSWITHLQKDFTLQLLLHQFKRATVVLPQVPCRHDSQLQLLLAPLEILHQGNHNGQWGISFSQVCQQLIMQPSRPWLPCISTWLEPRLFASRSNTCYWHCRNSVLMWFYHQERISVGSFLIMHIDKSKKRLMCGWIVTCLLVLQVMPGQTLRTSLSLITCWSRVKSVFSLSQNRQERILTHLNFWLEI